MVECCLNMPRNVGRTRSGSRLSLSQQAGSVAAVRRRVVRDRRLEAATMVSALGVRLFGLRALAGFDMPV
jgi:hypothetical protein